MLGAHERFVALDVDVDVSSLATGNFVHSLGATAVGRRSHQRFPAVFAADLHDLFRVGGDDYLREQRRRSHGFVHHADQGLARNLAKHLAGQAGGSQTGRNDSDRFHGLCGHRESSM